MSSPPSGPGARRFAAALLAAAGWSAALAPAVARAETRFFTREIGSAADCHREYDTLAGDWRHHAWFMRRELGDGRERVLNCLPDGVEELVCNPGGGKLVVAIATGRTEAACRPYTPKLPLLRGPLLPE